MLLCNWVESPGKRKFTTTPQALDTLVLRENTSHLLIAVDCNLLPSRKQQRGKLGMEVCRPGQATTMAGGTAVWGAHALSGPCSPPDESTRSAEDPPLSLRGNRPDFAELKRFCFQAKLYLRWVNTPQQAPTRGIFEVQLSNTSTELPELVRAAKMSVTPRKRHLLE